MRVMQRGVGPDEDDRRPLAVYVPRVGGRAGPRAGGPSPPPPPPKPPLPRAKGGAGGAGPPAARVPPPLLAKAYVPERMRGYRAAARFLTGGGLLRRPAAPSPD